MAIINCPECGERVSDKATSCPHCGYPISQKTGIVHLFWGDKGAPGKTSVFVDGEEISTLKSEETFDFETTFGEHEIELVQKRRILLRKEIDLSINDSEAFFSFKQKMGFMHPKLIETDFNMDAWSKKHVTGTPRCPTCGSTNIRRLSASGKIFAISMIGTASNSMGKTFVCQDCKYKW